MRTQTDVLVIGSGAAGMYAALEAARHGAAVMLIDRSLIGRGGATVMAQMTVAVALGEEEPDHWEHHLADTLKAGRELCDEALSQLLCEEAPACIRAMDAWGAFTATPISGGNMVVPIGSVNARCTPVCVPIAGRTGGSPGENGHASGGLRNCCSNYTWAGVA